MDNNTNTFLGLLAGVATGAILGILYAPDKGVNTRKLVAEKTKDAADKLKVEADVVKDKLMTEAEIIRNSLANNISSKKQTLDEQLDVVVSHASHKAEDVITSLESKLATLKATSKKLQKTV